MYQLLIADDEFANLTGLTSLGWENLGIEVAAFVSNGVEAYHYIESHHVDLVFTDIKMPYMDGLELSQKLYENYPSIIVIVLSGYDDFSLVKQCLKNKVFDYLLKPLDIDEWYETFKTAVRYLEKTNTDPTRPHAKKQQNQITGLCIDYLNKHYFEQLTLDDAANSIHTSRAYLCRIFKQDTGVGFTDYLTQLRLNKAKELLKQSTLKVYEISEKVGFTNPRYFARIFKKYTGMTPHEFRGDEL